MDGASLALVKRIIASKAVMEAAREEVNFINLVFLLPESELKSHSYRNIGPYAGHARSSSDTHSSSCCQSTVS